MDISELEQFYLKAKKAYYDGDPIISDDEFDRIEQDLKDMGSDVISMVGASDRNAKFKHLSPMLSLAKAQALLDGTPPTDIIEKWISTFPKGTVFEVTPKYDGNAVNLIYRKGKFSQAITRGDGKQGRDVTSKVAKIIPLTIASEMDVEIRGEIVMPVSTFNAKYSNFKNPRNFVAGVLNKDDNNPETLAEIVFMAVEVRFHDGDYEFPTDTMQYLGENGFNTHFLRMGATEFVSVYNNMKNYREKISPYQLDGFVLKAQENLRKDMGDNGHDPNWAIAVKFPPKEAVTTVRSIDWKVGTTGEIVPTLEMDPVDLDGTTVKRAAGFNAGHLIKNGIFPGAQVAVAKSGDIIPIIVKVLKPVFDADSSKLLPQTCPCGKFGTVLEGIHLYCASDDCETKVMKRFVVGIGVFELDKFGGVTRENLFKAGYTQIHQIFDKDQFNKEKLAATEYFKEGKTLDYMLQEVEKVKKVPLWKLIRSLGFDSIGSSAAKQLAKLIRGQEYDFSGLEKKALEGFLPGEAKRLKVEKLIEVMEKRGIEIENEVVVSKDAIGFEMTGSPKGTGYDVKSDLEKFLQSHGFVHMSLKEAKLLLTDSLNSSSSKMAAANKKGIKIMEYKTLIDKLKAGEKIDL